MKITNGVIDKYVKNMYTKSIKKNTNLKKREKFSYFIMGNKNSVRFDKLPLELLTFVQFTLGKKEIKILL